jgi:disulfide bond formation protein DsbB
MSIKLTTAIRANPALAAALAVALGGAAAILGAYFFQFVLKILPCPLCLEQRIAYYVAIPLALMTAVMAARGEYRALVLAALVVIALIVLANAGLGVFHAGVEWKWWAGPTDCSGPVTGLGQAGDLLARMEATTVIRCDEAAWRFLGLSLAGYNVLISLALAAIALAGVAASRRAA